MISMTPTYTTASHHKCCKKNRTHVSNTATQTNIDEQREFSSNSEFCRQWSLQDLWSVLQISCRSINSTEALKGFQKSPKKD